MWKNFVERGKPQICRVRIARWLPKATNTRSEYVILIACPLQQGLHERALILHYKYMACSVTDFSVLRNLYNLPMKGGDVLTLSLP